MSSIIFEGRALPVRDGDTVAAVLHRAGVQIFGRSFKYHRPRGLYCLSGDCSHCLVRVNDEPAVRACQAPAEDGLQVIRENGWPSVEHDAGSIFWHVRGLLPVGFYYKTFVHPRGMWQAVEPSIRRVAGIGRIDLKSRPAHRERRHYHPDVCVLGGGIAGLAAALACADRGESVVLAEAGLIGGHIAPGPTRTALGGLEQAVRQRSEITILEQATATGIYEGPLVTIAARDFVHMVRPQRVVVATGAIERHAVFPGSDLPGVWLGRGAARMAGVHGVPPGRSAVVVIETPEALEHVDVLLGSGMAIERVVAPSALAGRVPAAVPVLRDGTVLAAKGTRRVTAVTIRVGTRDEIIACDTLVLSLGFAPRDSLLRQAPHCPVDGAGDVLNPGLSITAAIESGRTAASRRGGVAVFSDTALVAPTAGIVCTCEDVGATELAQAWREGFRSTELLKRYTTATMGPCQGALCHPHLRAFVRARTPDTRVAAPTTARPPARGMTVEDAAAGVRGSIEQRTALHDRHIAAGARMDWAGAWKRAAAYGDATAEYWAVRRNVSIMDVGTLGKFIVHGPDAPAFLDRLSPSNVLNLKTGRSRYTLYLNEAGYIIDDGMIAAVGDHEYFVTATSSGADSAEAWMRDWVEAWGMRVHIVNQTAGLGAINIAGPRARDLLASVTTDAVDGASLPYSGLRRITVAGIPCLVLRVGFTGELSFELHHPRSRNVELWDALTQAGRTLELLPHGLDTLKLLRLEKGHILIGQDTDFDTTPAKIGLDGLVKYDKPFFLGQSSLRRLATIPQQRRLIGIKFAGETAPDEGAQIMVGGDRVGWVTSSRYSPGLQYGVALGWVTARNGQFPTEVVAVSRGSRRTPGVAVSGAFYDPKGERLRA